MMPKVPRAVTESDIDKRIQLWHTYVVDHPHSHINDFLGWTWEEYCDWVETGVIPSV